jgi:hypothetical protein
MEMPRQALPYIESLTKQYNARIHVLYVIPEIACHQPFQTVFGEKKLSELMEISKKTAKKRLDQICDEHISG